MHLRFGAVARGGLRWSDRREDFRTEVLGLVKAQMVKNTVIVPVGAKGGFFVKQLARPGVDRDAWLAEGIACYRTFISGAARHHRQPRRRRGRAAADVVRHDGDDTYLVVAADKGTATFSDIANGVAHRLRLLARRRVRLRRLGRLRPQGDGHHRPRRLGVGASGTSASWAIDTQTEDFTVVGIGDMTGDVFGNGMLLSEHIRLVAAFDHRHIFLDPTPDAATSYAERRRLFELPRSSWADYDQRADHRGRRRSSRARPSRSRSARRCATALGLAGRRRRD